MPRGVSGGGRRGYEKRRRGGEARVGMPREGTYRRALAHSAALRRRRALLMTDTELKLMAAAAIIGLSRSPKAG